LEDFEERREKNDHKNSGIDWHYYLKHPD
jgi:hypothetical protein